MLKLAVKPQGMQEKGKDWKGKEKRKKGMQEGRADFPLPSLSHILSCATPTLSLTIFPKCRSCLQTSKNDALSGGIYYRTL